MGKPPRSNSATVDHVAEGRTALLNGEKDRARELLEAAVREDPGNIEAWLWLSGAYAEPKEMARCLRQALLIEPGNTSALEGLAWVQETFGLAATIVAEPRPPVQERLPLPASDAGSLREQIPAPVRSQSAGTPSAPNSEMVVEQVRRRPSARAGAEGSHALLEAGLHAASFGALLGLLRLAGSLRPGTLLLIRGPDGLVSLPAALGLALVTALLHAGALLATWILLGYAVARLRTDRQGDRWASLVQVGRIFVPGYLVTGALALVAGSLSWSQQRWETIVLLVWAVLLVSCAMIGRRLLLLLGRPLVTPGLPVQRRLRIALPALLAAAAGLACAGFVTQALLRAI